MSEYLFIIGTRPEITKIAPIANKINCKILFTGQHFSKTMLDGFFDLIKNKEIINLNLRNFKNFNQNDRLLAFEISKKIQNINPNKVIVQGDTNSTLIGAIAAKASNKKLYFIESGMRSFDILQIEEYNRVITSHLADINFCNHITNKKNLIDEGISKNKIFTTGSTVYSSVKLVDSNLNLSNEKDYILLTLHRPENVDSKENLIKILNTIDKLNYETIFPIHPRTKEILENDNIKNIKNINFVKPKKYKDFLDLIKYSKFIISDSGGVQEEAAIYRKPLLIPRNYTERPEMLEIFNLLVKNNKQLLNESRKLINNSSKLQDAVLDSNLLYGKEDSVEKIIDVLKKH